ncbi:Uncharacterised protein [Vibrio cholerae]|nr:Uncharacterised protein [Vibrio cholerae]
MANERYAPRNLSAIKPPAMANRGPIDENAPTTIMVSASL